MDYRETLKQFMLAVYKTTGTFDYYDTMYMQSGIVYNQLAEIKNEILKETEKLSENIIEPVISVSPTYVREREYREGLRINQGLAKEPGMIL